MRSSLTVVLFVLILLPCKPVLAGDGYYLNPGFKFSHTFGEHGGFTIGAEISYTKYVPNERISGILVSYDYCRNANRFRYHIGVEYMAVAIGPTFIVEEDASDFGISLSPFFGLVIIPYYNYTIRFGDKNDLHEAGAFLKFPILVKGKGFTWH